LGRFEIKDLNKKMTLELESSKFSLINKRPRPYQDYYDLLFSSFSKVNEICQKTKGEIFVDMLDLTPRVVNYRGEETLLHDYKDGPTGLKEFFRSILSSPSCYSLFLALKPTSRHFVEKAWKASIKDEIREKISLKLTNQKKISILLFPGFYRLRLQDYHEIHRSYVADFSFVVPQNSKVKNPLFVELKHPELLEVAYKKK
jgi:hypothetical protein